MIVTSNTPVFAVDSYDDSLDYDILQVDDETTSYEVNPDVVLEPLSEEQIEEKQLLSENLTDTLEIFSDNQWTDEELYVEGEIVFSVNSEAEAYKVAEEFNGELISYDYDIAVVELPEDVSVESAVIASTDMSNDLPAIWPNVYYELEFEDFNVTYDPYLYDSSQYYQWAHEYIGTEYVWAKGYRGQGVRVAILDTGLNEAHEDIDDNVIGGKDFSGGSISENHVDNGSTGHGSHCAGIIAGEYNDLYGSGIAPEANVCSLCVFTPSGTSKTSNIVRAIEYAIDEGFDVMSMSFGSGSYDGKTAEAILKAYNSGVAVFCSAGNDKNSSKHYPSSYPGAISIGAINETGSIASFSNYGEDVDFAFPGVDIYSLNYLYKNASETPSKYPYVSKQGTSMACPMAAGTAAVVLSSGLLNGKIGRNKVDSLINLMRKGAIKSSSSGLGNGTTYLPSALSVPVTPDIPVISVKNKESLRGDGKNTFYEPEITATITGYTQGNISIYYTINGANPTFKNGKVTNGIKLSDYTVTNKTFINGDVLLSGNRKMTLKAIAVNEETGLVSKMATATYYLSPYPEKVEIYTTSNVSGNYIIQPGKSVQLKAEVLPTYSVSTKVGWSLNENAKNAGITINNQGVVKVPNGVKPAIEGKEYKAIATTIGSDRKTTLDGVTSEFEIKVETASIVTSLSSKTRKALEVRILPKDISLDDKKNNTINISDYILVNKADVESGQLIFTSTNKSIVAVDYNTGEITANSPGTAKILAIAKDGSGKSVTISVKVLQPVTSFDLSVNAPISEGSAYYKILRGKSFNVVSDIKPANAYNKQLTWTISSYPEGYNSKYPVTVNKSGKVSVNGKATIGNYTVKAVSDKTYDSGKTTITQYYTFTVVEKGITGIWFDTKNVTLFTHKVTSTTPIQHTLNKTITVLEGGDDSCIEYISSNPSIASVSANGIITAHKAGKTVITLRATDGSGKKATCSVNVNIPMSKLTVSPALTSSETQLSIARGYSSKVVTRYNSAYGKPSNRNIVWSIESSPTGNITINGSGVVKVSKYASIGDSATIIATAKDGSGVCGKLKVSVVRNTIGGYFELSNNLSDGNHPYVRTVLEYTDDYGTIRTIEPSYVMMSVDGKNVGLLCKIDGQKCYCPVSSTQTVSTKHVNPADYKTWIAGLEAAELKGEKAKIDYLTKTGRKVTLTSTIRDGSNRKIKGTFILVRTSDNYVYTYPLSGVR